MSDLDTDRYKLLFDVRRSVRYHTRRHKFFYNLDIITSVVTVVSGSAAFFAIQAKAEENYALIAAAVVTVLSAISMLVGSATKACAHKELARRFIKLEKKS